MFLHIGNSKNLRIRDVIGIFDMDNATISTVTRKYLSVRQKEKAVESAAEDIPKSFVLYRDGNKTKICFSQLSASALKGRMDELL